MSTSMPPSMRQVLDDIAAQKEARDAAMARERVAAASDAGRETPNAARWRQLEAHLTALSHEAAEQTRLLREILARLADR